MQADAAAGQKFVSGQDVFAPGIASQGQDRRVLQKQERIGDLAGLAQRNDALLQGECVRVGNAAGREEVDEHGAGWMIAG